MLVFDSVGKPLGCDITVTMGAIVKMAATTSISTKMELCMDLMGAHIYSLFVPLTVSQPEAPTNLVTSDATHQSFRATWTPPEDLPEKYRVEYTSPTGQTRQVPSIIQLLR